MPKRKKAETGARSPFHRLLVCSLPSVAFELGGHAARDNVPRGLGLKGLPALIRRMSRDLLRISSSEDKALKSRKHNADANVTAVAVQSPVVQQALVKQNSTASLPVVLSRRALGDIERELQTLPIPLSVPFIPFTGFTDYGIQTVCTSPRSLLPPIPVCDGHCVPIEGVRSPVVSNPPCLAQLKISFLQHSSPFRPATTPRKL